MTSPATHPIPACGEAFSPEATILVVDDYAVICQILFTLLSRAGFRVLTATGAVQAQALARSTPKIDLLLTDLEMPEMTGDELAGWFSAVHPLARIVFISGYSDHGYAPQSAPFIAKPFHAERLLTTVRAALEAPLPTASAAA